MKENIGKFFPPKCKGPQSIVWHTCLLRHTKHGL